MKEKSGVSKILDLKALNTINKETICTINCLGEEGTDVFLQIPSPRNENEYINTLLTCYHVIPFNESKNNIIQISYNIENKGKKCWI